MKLSRTGTLGDEQNLDTIAAEMTDAAFAVALQHGAGQHWLELELDLWKALTDTVRKYAPDLSQAGINPDVLLSELHSRRQPQRASHLALAR
jgi:hypothetical protein